MATIIDLVAQGVENVKLAHSQYDNMGYAVGKVSAGGPGSGRHSSYGGYKQKSRADKDAQGGLHAKYKNGNHEVKVIDNRSADKGVAKGRGAVVVTHQFHTDDESTDHSRKEFSNMGDAKSHLKSTYGINHI
jgi:hypothetical protein